MDENPSKIDDYFDELLARSSQFAFTVADEIGKLPTNTQRQKVALLLLASALNHYRSINFLLNDGRYIGSALAIIRPIADASYRAIWIARFATEAKVSTALVSDAKTHWPTPKEVTELLQLEFRQVLPDELTNVKDDWGRPSGFVHTGSSQLKNHLRYHWKGYPDAIRVRIITKSSSYITYGACVVATSIGIDGLATAKRIDNEFDALDRFGEEILRPSKSTVN